MGKGAEMVQASLDDINSLERAFEGSNAIFIVTDHVSNVQKISEDEMLREKARELGKSIEAYAGDLEAVQGINAAKAASHPKVLATLEKYIFSTLPGVTKGSGGQFTHAYEFDAEAEAEEYIRQNLPQLNQRTSTVICGSYLENWPYIDALAPQKEEDGSYSFLWLDCPGEHTAHPELWAIKDTGIFVKALVLDHPASMEALACTAIIGAKDYAALWSRVMRLPAQHKVVSEAEYAALVPEDIRKAFLELIKYVTQHGLDRISRLRRSWGYQLRRWRSS